MPRLLSWIIASLFALSLVSSCQFATHIEEDDAYYRINIPINQKAVYAILHYEEFADNDSLVLSGISIGSLIFNNQRQSGDTLFLMGKCEVLEIENDIVVAAEMEPITIALTRDWVFLDDSNGPYGYTFLLKNSADTTRIPTVNHEQFPLLPRVLTVNTRHSIYRPGSPDYNFIGVNREFSVMSPQTWSDELGTEQGIFLKIKHVLDGIGDELNFEILADDHGIIRSFWSFQTIHFDPQTGDGESLTVHRINRRIVDYTDPRQVQSLEYYYNLVNESGLRR